jgi:hypothetical protein
VLRGKWILETILGTPPPPPPPAVPALQETHEGAAPQTLRERLEEHRRDPVCASCHSRIDPLGFALEGFDAIARRREKDLGDRPIETAVKTLDGAEFDGLGGLRNYLATTRRDAFLRQFCRKLLGYALGRSVQLSDEPLLTEMQAALKANDYKIVTAVESIVKSRQFREIRGRETAYDE